MSEIQTKPLALKLIRTDGGTQARAKIDKVAVIEYAQAMKSGDKFPPVVIFFDGQEHWLADGFHRFYAATNAGHKNLLCEIRPGSLRDAVLFSVGANQQHGVRRTSADKRNAVEMLLADKEWAEKSNNWISDQAGVSQPFVSKIRKKMGLNVQLRQCQDGRIMNLGKMFRDSDSEDESLEPTSNGRLNLSRYVRSLESHGIGFNANVPTPYGNCDVLTSATVCQVVEGLSIDCAMTELGKLVVFRHHLGIVLTPVLVLPQNSKALELRPLLTQAGVTVKTTK